MRKHEIEAIKNYVWQAIGHNNALNEHSLAALQVASRDLDLCEDAIEQEEIEHLGTEVIIGDEDLRVD